jgi:hypothetical protein
MSATTPAATDATAGEEFCRTCGAHLDADQEWCLECGTARTVIRRAPSWRAPLAVLGLVLAAAVAAIVVALVDLSGTAPTVTRTVTVHAPAATPPAAAPLTIASWPPGESGWTVVLSRAADAATADTTARQLAAAGVSGIGVLNTNEHPRLKPDEWLVFAGRYPDQSGAEAAAAALARRGHPPFTVVEVAGPGGI